MNWAEDDNFWNDTPDPVTTETNSASAPKGPFCPQCGSTSIESHQASGESICTQCGIVLEENAIVSSVQFQEGAGGSSSMVGKFVSSTSSTAYTGGGSGGRGRSFGFSRDSRETTLLNGRKRIQEVASRLRLNQHFVDCAARMYAVAVEKNFVQGRRTTHVVASCLYMACRMENSQHMLIDFSDALQVNVYTLGTCFLKFRRLLGYKLKIETFHVPWSSAISLNSATYGNLNNSIILKDPALFVYRFAAHLDLEDKANAVALTALRIVGRMQRDWIVSGRRPAGICAAALLIASRAHGFSRSKHDVTKVLRVCGMTVNARVKEFEYTPSSSLTLNQFHEYEIEAEADPPCFTKNRIKEARALAIKENNVALLTSGALDDPRDGKRKSNWRQQQKISEKAAKYSEMYDSIEAEVRQGIKKNDAESTNKSSAELEIETQSSRSESNKSQQLTVTTSNDHEPSTDTNNATTSQIKYPLGGNGRALVLPNEATPTELQPAAPVVEKIDLNGWKADMPDYAAEEIESLFRGDEEVAQKEAIFNTMNKDYIAKMEQKEAEEEAAAKEEKNIEDDDLEAEEQAKIFKRKRKLGLKAGDDLFNADDPTTEEVLRATVSSRKISRKINYEAMSSIFDDDGGFSTDLLDDNEGPGLEAGIYQDV